mmetsp:Transcript_12185/g.26841  ORF Transcript_12185/g.26841 Transcript_12185/m.26841 type:complete len:224 (+) Transcript_12185:613-1284(+)
MFPISPGSRSDLFVRGLGRIHSCKVPPLKEAKTMALRSSPASPATRPTAMFFPEKTSTQPPKEKIKGATKVKPRPLFNKTARRKENRAKDRRPDPPRVAMIPYANSALRNACTSLKTFSKSSKAGCHRSISSAGEMSTAGSPVFGFSKIRGNTFFQAISLMSSRQRRSTTLTHQWTRFQAFRRSQNSFFSGSMASSPSSSSSSSNTLLLAERMPLERNMSDRQ